MKKSILAIRFIVLFLSLTILFPSPLLADVIGEFKDIRGNVSLNRSKTILKPAVGDNVQSKDMVATGDKSRAKLLLSDESLLSVGQNSNLEITEYLLDKSRRTSIISLKAGSLHSKVEKFLEPDSKFEVHTPTAIAGARGTAWLTVIETINNVIQSTVYAMEQSVAVFNPAFPSQIVTVAAGNFTTVAAGLAPTIPAAFAPAAVQGFMGQIGLSMPAGAGASTVGAGAGIATAGGIGAGTIAAAVVGTAVVAAGIASASSSSDSSPTTTTTTHH